MPKTSGRAPPPCDSFSFVRVDAERVVLFGGWVPKDKHRSHSVYILNLKTWVRRLLLQSLYRDGVGQKKLPVHIMVWEQVP